MTDSGLIAVDTSVAVPLLSRGYLMQSALREWAHDKELYLCGHAAVETYAVLTRLPGELRVSGADAVRLMADTFAGVLPLPQSEAIAVHRLLAAAEVVGGACYDALVALAAKAHGATLVTRDNRARPTYGVIGARVEVLALSAP